MERIGLIDIAEESRLYIIERKAGNLELKDKIPFSCTKDYDISMPALPANIDEFYLSLPLSALNFRILDLPFSDREKILNVLPFELDGLILNGIESVIIDGIILGGSGGKNTVIAVYIEKSVLNKIIERLKEFNIDPRVITSIELGYLGKDFVPERLLEPVDIKSDERIKTAIEELRNSSINLRRGEFSYTKDTERTGRSLRLTAILVILVLVLFSLSIILKVVSIKKEISSLQGEINRIYSEVFPDDKKTVPNLYRFKSKMKELKDRGEVLIGISPLSILLDLSSIERGNVTFNEISIDKGHVTLKGDAVSLSDVQKIREGLGKVLSEVNISDSKTSSQNRVMFTITAKGKKG